MGKIKDDIERRIKDSASIVDVMQYDLGVQLHRSGAEYEGLCPFHADRHLGSFKVSESKNIATCFSCGKTWDPIAALMEGAHMDYPTALRHLAARYHIWIDDEPVPTVTPAKPREKVAELPLRYWLPKNFVKAYLNHEDMNPLLQYLNTLPLKDEHKVRLKTAINDMYFVGTSVQGWTAGFTIWWQIDEECRLRTGKLMAYRADGHRDKERKPNFTWMHSLLLKAGRWSDKTHQVKTCLFGQHLLLGFKHAEVCIVESEKTALLCSAFTDPNKRIWMATAGKSALTREKLLPLIKDNRYIILYPDYDAYDEWLAAAKRIGYPKLSVSDQVRKYWIPEDGQKADIADIMVRLVSAPQETTAEVAARRLGRSEKVEVLADIIDKLGLTLED